MSRISRKTQKIFGETAGLNEIGIFGSLGAGSPNFTTDPTVAQSLSQYSDGWFSAVLGDNAPAIEDMNALCFIFGYQAAYILQQGIPEWDVDTTYYTGQFVSWQGFVYVSLVDTNLGNAVSNTAKWYLYDNRVRTVTVSEVAGLTDSLLRLNGTGISLIETLPPVASTPVGKSFTLKNVSTDGSDVTVQGNASELIDGSNTVILHSTPTLDSMTIINNGTSWDIV